MKEWKLVINPFAEIDLKVAHEWYNLQKENLGNEFLSEIGKIIKLIKANPHQFSIKQKNIHKAVLKRFPFTIFYTIQNNLIIVFAVFHNSRNPIVWKSGITK